MRVFKDRDGRRWTIEIGGFVDRDSAQKGQNMMDAFGATVLAFESLDGKERRTLTVQNYVADLNRFSEDRFRAWLEQAQTTDGHGSTH